MPTIIKRWDSSAFERFTIMHETDTLPIDQENELLNYGTIVRFLHGTHSEAVLDGFGNMFDIRGTQSELIDTRVRSAILERYATALDMAAKAEATWQATEETATDERIQHLIDDADWPRILLPPSQLIDKFDDLVPGVAKRIADKAPNYLEALHESEDVRVTRNQTFRQVGQGVGLTFLIFPLILALAASTIGEPFLAATSLSLSLATYLAKIKARGWSRNHKSQCLEIVSDLLRVVARYQNKHER